MLRVSKHINTNLPKHVVEAQKKLSEFCNDNKNNELYGFDIEVSKDKVEDEERLTIDVTFKK